MTATKDNSMVDRKTSGREVRLSISYGIRAIPLKNVGGG